MKKQITTFFLIFSSTLLFAQALEVEYPNKLDYKRYWKNFALSNRFELDFNNITKSNNEFWRKKADLRFNTGKYQKQHWNHIIKKIKRIEESIYENKKGANNKIEYFNTYNFNTFGSITEKIHSYNDGKFKDKEVYVYNENQNIVEYSKYKYSSDPDYRYTNSKYEFEEKHTFKYNKNNQLILKEGSDSQKIIYIYCKLPHIRTA
ncbi:hypothetical protein Q4566_13365 [Tamlana sp. 2_MG-2023]|uniref:hypothetical protein n=1 Tax=unclassified Tamlana TaxID=2614803 RepID=UPI0026E437EA|nr:MULTISPECIES: hypothetical protein [unclassified Tamlana]MDO6761194.1 hypothetical protein [Tamlana sp. 2_MG-2023]MDO6791473.1 hypothetical protein [Tamlana sp. 1_MG-2023]